MQDLFSWRQKISWRRKDWPLVLQVLLRPILILSLIVHLAFLRIPLPDAWVPESEAEKVEEETVKITSLFAPEPEPPPQPTLPAPQPEAIAPAQEPEPLPEPLAPESLLPEQLLPPEPLPEAPPEAIAQPDPPPETSKTQETLATPAVPPDPTETGKGLLTELRPRIAERLSESSNNFDVDEELDRIPYDLINPSQRNAFMPAETLHSAAFGSLNIPQTNPSTFYFDTLEPILVEQFQFLIEPIEPSFGDARLYRAINDDGVEFYMSLVKLKLGSGVFLVLWPTDPRTL